MTDEINDKDSRVVVASTRFGDLAVERDSLIEFPSGVIGFPTFKHYFMVEHKPPFSWLHSTEDGGLAFVVVDGFELGQQYDLSVPFSIKECDFRPDDEYAILLIVTVRPDPRTTTANLKAPLFVNIRNRRGVQVIYDDARYTTRYPLWQEEEEKKEVEK